MWRVGTLALLLALALALPAGAAARSLAPPGNSEADQYYETLPASAGPRAPDPSKREEDAVREGDLSPATAQALRGRGAPGQAMARAVAQTAPPRPARAGRVAPAAPASALRIPGRPGLGAAFPLALMGMAAAALAFAVARRRRTAVR